MLWSRAVLEEPHQASQLVGGRKRRVYALQNPEPSLAPKGLDLLSLEPSQLFGVGEVEGYWQALGRPGRPGRQGSYRGAVWALGPAQQLEQAGCRQWVAGRRRTGRCGDRGRGLLVLTRPDARTPQCCLAGPAHGGLQLLLLLGEETKPLLLLAEAGIRTRKGRQRQALCLDTDALGLVDGSAHAL